MKVIQLVVICTVTLFSSVNVTAQSIFDIVYSSENTNFYTLLNQIENESKSANLTETDQLNIELKKAYLYQQFERTDLLTLQLEKLIAYVDLQKNDIFSVHWHFLSAFNHYFVGKYHEADELYGQSIDMLTPLNEAKISGNDKLLLATTIDLYRGLNLAYLQNYNQAIELLSKVRDVAEENQWPILVARAVYFLGDINYELKNYEEALQNYDSAFSLYPRYAALLIAQAEMAKAQMINIVGDRSEAISLLDKAITIFIDNDHANALAYAYLLKAYFLDKAGEVASALPWIAKSVEIREQLNNPVDVANAYVHYSSMLFENMKPIDAIDYALKAVDLIEQSDDLAGKWDAYNNLARIYAGSGDYKLAYDFMFKSERALLAKARLDITSETARLNSQFNLQQEQLTNQLLDQKNASLQRQLEVEILLQKRQMWAVILLSIILLLISFLLIVIYKLYRKNHLLATKDMLTGLNNRRSILAIGDGAFASAVRYKHDLCVLMMDVDHFKSINDNFGHEKGDAVLAFIAEVADSTIREADYVGRVGGEEFLFVLPHITQQEGLKFAQRLCSEVTEKATVGNICDTNITVSIGLASNIEKTENFLALANLADIALYEAKKSGRNQVQVYRAGMQFKGQAFSGDSIEGSAVMS